MTGCRDRVIVNVAHRAGEPRGTIASEHDVISLLHHLTRDDDRIFHALQARDRADLRLR